MDEAGRIKMSQIPPYATLNGNMFFIITKNPEERSTLLDFLKKSGIYAVFHYLPLHSSDFFHDKHDGRELPNTDHFSECIIRLPFFNEMKKEEIDFVAESVKRFFV